MAFRVKLVGDDPEIDRLERVIREAGVACTRAKDTDDACETDRKSVV